MADSIAKPVIFISYSHKDRAWLEYVRSFLSPLAKHSTLTIWDDEKLQIGDDWKSDIYSALDACNVFIVLVSRYSLASNFIIDEEVGRILKRPKAEVRFCPIVVTPSHMPELDWLEHPNRRPKNGKALSELPDPERDREMAIITGQIAQALAISVKTASGPSPTSPASQPTSAVSFPAIVDYARLPETPYKHLVGRNIEITRLDDAWADKKTNIISLIAWGGAGKTALVNEWLVQLRKDNYRDADAVLGWSFYSQGTKERATSAEGFLDWALGKLNIKADTTSSNVKGEKLAEEMAKRRVLLVLDGVEPLQHGPEGQKGALKDQGLRTFLRGYSATPPATAHGLVVLTSRLPINELQKWKDSAAPVIDLGRLTDEAGAALLADNGVKGTASALREAAHEFAGHALALSLLASFLTELHHGDVRQRDRIRGLLDDPNDPGHDHARRVMESYEKEWLAREPALLEIMKIIGLFDRPASADCLASLRMLPAVPGLTDTIVSFDDIEWRRAVARLRDVRLLDPEDPSAPDALDAHPLVREWFGERLQQTNGAAWKAAHGRLYEHLRDTTEEGQTPSLEELAPLYQAIAHGCRAERHAEALRDIYHDRICRRDSGTLAYYTIYHLGSFGSDLAAISWFFEKPYDTPVATLPTAARSWVLAMAGPCLRATGRITEALPAHRATLQSAEESENWQNAARAASLLSECEMLVGNIPAAVQAAAKSVSYADNSKHEFEMMTCRSIYADALHAAGRRMEAERLFTDAERLEKMDSLLYGDSGVYYCDLLLAKGNYATVRERATKALAIARENKWPRETALDTLTLARADHGIALERAPSTRIGNKARRTGEHAINLDLVVNGLYAAGAVYNIPRGLLARASFRRNIGDWGSAARDLDEVEEIAEPGLMRLYLCDMALERGRLAFARIEAYAPLSGMFERENLSKPAGPNAQQITELKSEAEKQLSSVADDIEKCGYHRRDEELAELQAVLRGEKKFADLPPRV